MHIGVDFDNTIVCYDGLFHDAARRHGLIPDSVPPAKDAIRNYLRGAGREEDWTELQGYVYGRAIAQASPFPGALKFFRDARIAGVTVTVISHKTRTPARGPAYDLHEAAWKWLAKNGLVAAQGGSRAAPGVFFEETKEGKVARIETSGCTHFVDDLVEFLTLPGFPDGVVRVLFDPHRREADTVGVVRAGSWDDIREVLGLRGLSHVRPG